MTEKEIFTYKQALERSIQYFDGDDLASAVFVDKYALRNEKGEILEDTPEKMHRRLAKEFARIEKKYPNPLSEDEIFNLIDKFKYIIPQGSPMYGIGNPYYYISLSNCFVVESPLDSYSSICKTDEQLVNIAKRRGGTGLDISNLRPKGFSTKNAARSSTGIISFMERYSNTIREVGQGGRRGALIITISVHHPEIMSFINSKKDLKKITGANISIRVTDEFLNAVENNEKYELRFPVDAKKEDKQYSEMIESKGVWDKIIKANYNSAEPGVLFWDNIIRESPADCYEEFKTISTNPCVTGDTLVSTDKGDISIKKLIEDGIENYKAVTFGGDKLPLENIVFGAKTKENAKIIEIETESGHMVKLTPDHMVLLYGEGYVEAKLLKIGDYVLFRGEGGGETYNSVGSCKIKQIKELEEREDVYDITVENNHNFFANGILVHNCAELPLSANDSCRLLLLNLYSFVKNPFTKDAYFDFDDFTEKAKIAQRLMDDMVDLELECVDRIIKKIKQDPEPIDIKRDELALWQKIKKSCENGRRTGTGANATGDMLAACGIKYGTKESIDFIEKVFRALKLACYRSSVEMAKERGYFSCWDHEKEKNNPFLLRIKEEDLKLWNDMKKHGRRNIGLQTLAPSGCLEEDAKIKTDRGNISLKELFKINNVDLDDLRGEKDIWFNCDEEIFVFDVNGGINKINKLYWKGETNGEKFVFSDGFSIKTSLSHKFLVLVGKNKAEWKESSNIKVGDKIIKIK